LKKGDKEQTREAGLTLRKATLNSDPVAAKVEIEGLLQDAADQKVPRKKKR
jgi:hypothetical protein